PAAGRDDRQLAGGRCRGARDAERDRRDVLAVHLLALVLQVRRDRSRSALRGHVPRSRGRPAPHRRAPAGPARAGLSPEPALLTGLPLGSLTERLGSPARARAVRRWLFGARPVPVALPGSVDGVARARWRELAEGVALPEWRLVRRSQAADGTLKY